MESRQDLQEKCRSLGIQFLPNDTVAKLKSKIKKHTMKTDTKNGNITPEQIEAWKQEYKTVYTIAVKTPDGGEAVGYLRKPKRDHKAVSLSLYAQNKILEAGEFLRDNCWLGGDARLKSDEDIADTAAVQASGIVKFLDATLGEA